MPGERTSALAPGTVLSSRATTGRPAADAAARRSGASSQASTAAPPRLSACAAARPERARPSTATFSFSNAVTSIIPLPQFQRGKPRDRQHRSDDPEADDDGRLLPSLLLEVVMERRHAKDPLARELEARHLHDHRHGLEHEEAADNGEHQLVLGDDADHADGTADRER